MKKVCVGTDKAPAPIGPYSQAVVCGEFVFTAGQDSAGPEEAGRGLHRPEHEPMSGVDEAGVATFDMGWVRRYKEHMMSEKERLAIVKVAARYGARRVLVFGSAADRGRKGRDIDLAVEGVRPRDFFAFYGDLLFAVSRPVDLVDLSSASKFTRLIRRDGIRLYG